MEHAAENRQNGAGELVARSGMPDTFTAHTILLVGEGEVDRRGGQEFGNGGGGGGKLAAVVEERDIHQTKRGIAGLSVGGIGVFPRATQEKEA